MASSHLIVFRQEQATPELVAAVHSRQKRLITLFRWQGIVFTMAAVMSVVPVFAHFFRG
jgi:hypothetical protein